MKRFALLLVACGHSSASSPPPPPPPAPDAAAGCAQEKFPDTLPVPEASGAAFDDRGDLVIVGDSGNDGAYLVIDPETGATIEQGKLPLGDGASDDVESFAKVGDQYLGLTSSGWMRAWKRDGKGFTLVDGPYPIGPVDASLKSNPPAGGLLEPPTDAIACAGPSVNCGKNYEALCMAPAPAAGDCVGWAGAKADGALLCLVADGARVKIDPTRTIPVVGAGAMSDCAFADDGTIWVLTNAFDGGIYRVANGKKADAVPMPSWGFSEAMAIRGEAGVGSPRGRQPERTPAGATPAPADAIDVWRFTDNGSAPSPAQRWRCALRSPGAVPEVQR